MTLLALHQASEDLSACKVAARKKNRTQSAPDALLN